MKMIFYADLRYYTFAPSKKKKKKLDKSVIAVNAKSMYPTIHQPLNPIPGNKINLCCHVARGYMTPQMTTRKEGGLMSCHGHSQNFLAFT
jgi:hypothetical protein